MLAQRISQSKAAKSLVRIQKQGIHEIAESKELTCNHPGVSNVLFRILHNFVC